jgi:hypothetical protein
MKRISFLTLCLLLAGISTQAQIQKNTFLLGGYADIRLSTNDDDSYLILNPDMGYFVADRICVGISLPIAFIGNNSYWGLTTFGRYYFNVKDTRSLFLFGSVGLTAIYDSDHIVNSDFLTLGIGHVWFLNKSIGLEVKGYLSSNLNDLNTGMNVGFHIYFNKSNK